jgi:Fe-S oxidoreductase
MCTIEQCNGSGDCRKSNIIGGTMCPAFKVSGDELKTTRGRANVLREVLTRGGDWSTIKEILDTCLACKGCHGECPSNVDMTRLRAELLQHYYNQHGTPLRSWLVARTAQMEDYFQHLRPLYNFFVSFKPTASLIKKTIGFADERELPKLKKVNFCKQVKEGDKKIWLFLDEFTRNHEPEIAEDFMDLLSNLGYSVSIPKHQESGRAAISKGCLKRAKQLASQNVRMLKDIVSEEKPLVGIEPSCILSFRDEYPDLVPAELRNDAKALGQHSLLFDEFLLREIRAGHIRRESFNQTPIEIFLHGHCHQKALVGVEVMAEVLRQLLNAKVNVIPSGCCGMAGSFGYEKEHYKTSLAIGEMVLFPAIRKIEKLKNPRMEENGTPIFVAAPGTSCRQQILDGTGVTAVHPIQLLFRYIKH